MNRREFLNCSIPATGAVLIAPGFFSFDAFPEIGKQFNGDHIVDKYDVLINGAGLSGYFAALEASKRGLKVLLIERRTSPGYEITAKRKLWIGSEGYGDWLPEYVQLFFPEAEAREIFKEGGTGPNNSLLGDELLLLSGTVKKGMLRNLLLQNIHVLLMTDVCGLISDDKCITGALLACKHGLFTVKCRNFVDASDHVLFSRDLCGQSYRIGSGGFVLELLGVSSPQARTIQVPGSLGILNNQIRLHPGKNSGQQAFVEFQFPTASQSIEEIEKQSRFIAAALGEQLPLLDQSFGKARVHYYAAESSLVLEHIGLPEVFLKGHYLLESSPAALSCKTISELQQSALGCVKKLDLDSSRKEPRTLFLVGSRASYKQPKENGQYEPNLSIPLTRFELPDSGLNLREVSCEVLVGGAGTSGGVAAIGAAERGVQTVVADYFYDPGGTKTVGGVMGYYHGLRNNAFINRLERESRKLAERINFSDKPARQVFLLKRLSELDVRYLGGALICGSLTRNRQVEGILICRHGRLEKVTGKLTIDATGDGDIAGFSGAEYKTGNGRNGLTQNYSQWNMQGGGKSPTHVNSDYDIIDITEISELQRGLFLSHYEAHFYDFHPYLTVRESRRIEGLYELNLIDAAESTHFDDLITVAGSDYDPHFVGFSEYTRCGFLLPHSNLVQVEIPYRAIIPKGLDGLLISGKAFSQTQNALQFTRMSADLTVLGYLTGQLAAEAVLSRVSPQDLNISPLQQEWYRNGYLPKDYAGRISGNRIDQAEEILLRVRILSEGRRDYLYECCKLTKEKALPVLLDFHHTAQGEGKLLISKALAWFGDQSGCRMIEEELSELFDREQQEGYPAGYTETYDNIRGREKNVLEGLFWRINQNIALLGMAGDNGSLATINRIMETASSGGTRVFRENDYFNERIDLRLVPFYNRILNLCFYAERVPDHSLISGFEKLLTDKNLSGYVTTDYHKVRWNTYGAVLEVSIGAALARCGSKSGYELLLSYFDDIHFNLRDFVQRELVTLSCAGRVEGKNGWHKYMASLAFPRPCMKLNKLPEC